MTTSPRILKHLETELRRMEDRLRATGTEPIPLDSLASPEERAHIGDFHDHALASQATEIAYANRSQLLKRRANL